MKKAYMCILLVLVLNLLFCGAAEIVCLEIDQLSDLKQSMLDYSFEQIEQWEKNYRNVRQEIDIMFDDELIDAIGSLQSSRPEVIYFFEVCAEEVSGMSIGEQANLFLNHSILANSMVDSLQGAYLDVMDIYGIFPNEEFQGVSYIVLYYARELPVIVTSFCEVSEKQVIAKTGLVYANGQFDNEFAAFAGSLLSRFGTDLFDIEYYRFSE